MYDELREGAERASELRGAFTRQHVHPSCDDTGHQHQLRLYTQLAHHFREQADELRSQPTPPPPSSANDKELAEHRAYLAECEAHREKLAKTARSLKEEWIAVQVAKERVARQLRKQQEADGKVAINEALLSHQREFIAHIKKRREKGWMGDIVVALMLLVSRYKRWPLREIPARLADDLAVTSALVREFCAFFFAASIESYSEALCYQLATFYYSTHGGIERAMEVGRARVANPAVVDAILARIAGIVMYGDEADEQRVRERAREIVADYGLTVSWPTVRLAKVTRGSRRLPLHVHFDEFMDAWWERDRPDTRKHFIDHALAHPHSDGGRRIGNSILYWSDLRTAGGESEQGKESRVVTLEPREWRTR